VGNVTRILEDIQRGDADASEQLLRVVYGELRRMAAAKMSGNSLSQTNQATALVHEAWMRLNSPTPGAWESRAHFFGAAAEAMRRILVENARKKGAVRHGGGQQRVDLTGLDLSSYEDSDHVIAVNDALEKFTSIDPLKAELVKLRYFIGLSMPETSDLLKISERTAHRWWNYARAWFQEELKQSG